MFLCFIFVRVFTLSSSRNRRESSDRFISSKLSVWFHLRLRSTKTSQRFWREMEMGLLEVLHQYPETVKERHARRAMPTSIVRDFGSRSETPVFFFHLDIKVPLL
jgi:hypothetical protein